MTCEETRVLLAAHLDGELDVVRDAAVVAHLDGCPACADLALAHAARRGMIQDKLIRHVAPADLRAKIISEISAADRLVTMKPSRFVLQRILPIAAGVMLAGAIGFRWGVREAREEAAVGDFVSDYVRAATTGHAMDVVSSDQHTVKPWFRGKLDFTPMVRDFATEGFPLAGGRIDRADGHQAAVLVYHRRKHVIDLYVSPVGAEPVQTVTTRAGFNLIGWVSGGQQYVAVSDLAAPELAEFVRLVQSPED